MIPTAGTVRGLLAAFGRSHPEIARLILFGSLARGEANANSDVDVVADFVAWPHPQRHGGVRLLGRS